MMCAYDRLEYKIYVTFTVINPQLLSRNVAAVAAGLITHKVLDAFNRDITGFADRVARRQSNPRRR